jgi:DNA-directed RNA polymerase subunit beta'
MDFPYHPEPLRSPLLCEADSGLCAACCQAVPGGRGLKPGVSPGEATIQAFLVARLAYLTRLREGAQGSFEARWPDEHAGFSVPRPLSRKIDLSDGLVYLADLLEARTPRPKAVLGETDGVVALDAPRGRQQCIRIIHTSTYQGEPLRFELSHPIPAGQALRVAEGDQVQAGEALSEGHPSPHAILRILGERALARWMLGELRSVFAAAGLGWSDMHGAILLRKMLSRVQIKEAGDTTLVPGELVERHRFFQVNEGVLRQGRAPAIAEPVLLGLSEL